MLDNYYPDEILTIRKFVEMHKARDLVMLLNVVNNPHVQDPLPFRESLISMCGPGIANNRTGSTVSSGVYWTKTELNVSQFEQLKQAMSNRGR